MNAKSILVREAGRGDEPAIVRLILELAKTSGDSSPVTETYVQEYLVCPGSHVLLAEATGRVIGLVSYSIRPDLYHAGPTALIEEMVVYGPEQGRGVGSALMSELLDRLARLGCVEASVAALPKNEGAQRFYRAHGLVEEAVFLEKHF
jgi:GNAT superfamily N-acetyltransferase